MRGKLLFSHRRKYPVFFCQFEISWQTKGPLGLWKSAPAPTAGKAVKGVDQFQLAVAALMNRMLRTQSRSCYLRHGHFGSQLTQRLL